MSVAPQAQVQEQEIVTGIVVGVQDKGNGRWQVQVDTGGQNPRGLWSRDATLVGQLMMMLGSQQTFLCGVSHWTRNDGTPVRSLWVNGVGPAQAQTAPAIPSPQVQPQPVPQYQQPTVVQPQAIPMGPVATLQQPQRVSEEEREMRIMRQAATKVAGLLISHVPASERTLDSVLSLSEKLVGYYRGGLQSSDGTPGLQNPHPDFQGMPQQPHHPDDDIPF